VLALLALAAFPVFAHAGGIPEYELEKNETELPGSQTTTKPKSDGGHHSGSQTNPAAHGSGAETEKNSESKSETSPEGESESSQQGGGGGGGSHGNGGNHPGGAEKSNAQSKPENKVGSAQKVANTSAKPAPSSSGGGSSPIVPILIAVAVLAAISIGVVLYRQRKGDSGPGSSDRRVSSPNAS
jgi:cobalamin biosynthesis Mg chelatase CobN